MKYLKFIGLLGLLIACIPKGKGVDDEKAQKAEPKQDVAMARTPAPPSPAVKSSFGELSLQVESTYAANKDAIVFIVGNLSNPCYKLDVKEVVREGDQKIKIHAEVTPPAEGTLCIQSLSEVNEPVSLGTVAASEDSWQVELWVNGSLFDSKPLKVGP